MKNTWNVVGLSLVTLMSTTAFGAPDYPLFGDVTGDCVVDINDMKAVNKTLTGEKKSENADVNEDGTVSVDDYFLVNVSVGATCGRRLLGDIDGNGQVNNTDFSKVLGAYGSTDDAFDINGDRIVDDQDIAILEANWGATLGRRLLGDINGDNSVDSLDLAEVTGAWGTGASAADMNGDNVVDAFELNVVRARFGATAGTQILGDVDGNLKVDHIDALLTRGARGTQLLQFDLNGDGKITTVDEDIVWDNRGRISSDVLKGDINGDWVVNDLDIDILEAFWGESYAQADLNGDGIVGSSDSATVLGSYGDTHGQQRTGDVDGDCALTDMDLDLIKAAWGTDFEPTDLNADGTVNALDLSIYLSAPSPMCSSKKPLGTPSIQSNAKKKTAVGGTRTKKASFTK